MRDFATLVLAVLACSAMVRADDPVTFPLGSMYATSHKAKGMLPLEAALSRAQQVALARLTEGAPTVVLSTGASVGDAVSNMRVGSHEIQVKPTDRVWLGVYFGSHGSNLPQYVVQHVEAAPGQVKMVFERAKEKFVTQDLFPYVVWVPLERTVTRDCEVVVQEVDAARAFASRKYKVVVQ